MDAALVSLSEQVGRVLTARSLTLATAESCTGGLIGAHLTAIPGSSAYYRGGVITYSNAAKSALAGVDPALLAESGAVSEPTARAMAEGARTRLEADLAVSTTGIAGPGGGSQDRPVGLVFIALAGPHSGCVERHIFPGDRQAIRRQAVAAAMQLILRQLGAL